MKLSWTTKEHIFYELSKKLAQKSEEASKLFRQLIEAWDPSHIGIQSLNDLEHECDQIVHEIMIKMNQTFVTPLDREDIFSLTKKNDDLVDIIQALSERMVLFQIATISEELKEMTLVLEQAVSLVSKGIQQIRYLKNFPDIFQLCIQINTLENQGDRIFERAIGVLFQNPQISALEVIKWKDIYDSVESAIDTCEDIADIIWGIAVKYG